MNLLTRFTFPAFLFLFIGILSLPKDCFAQPGTTYIDAALNNNYAYLQKYGESVYTLIGPYKVIGSSYLFGKKHEGNLFSKDEKAHNIFISYNTYNQEVEFYSTANLDNPLVKEPGSLDSFIIREDPSLQIAYALKFIYGSLLGVRDKCYYQEVAVGKRFCLYKRYKSGLERVSTNIIQAELRQFDLQYEYYYTDTQGKGVKELKRNRVNIIKEFKDVKDLSAIANSAAFAFNPEDVLRKAFDYLNN